MAPLGSIPSKQVVFTAAATLPFVLLIGIGWWGQVQVEDTEARIRALSAARSIAAKIDTHFTDIEDLSNRLSVAVSTNAADVDANDAMLRRAKVGLPSEIANIILLSPDGQNIGNAVGPHANAGDREYFQRVLADERLVVGDPIRSRSNLGWVIPVARPVRNERGKLQAVIVVAISVDGLREWIGPNLIPPGGLVKIVNSNEIEVATISNVANTGSDLNRTGNPARQLKMKEGNEVLPLYGNATRVVGFTKASRVPWLIAVGMPVETGPVNVAKAP